MVDMAATMDADEYGRSAAPEPAPPQEGAIARSVLRSPPGIIKQLAAQPLKVGQKVLADSVANLGLDVNNIRAKDVAKVVGGMAVPTLATIAAKAAISLAVTAALPAAASVIIPAGFLLWSAYQLGKSAEQFRQTMKEHTEDFKEQGMSGGKAFLMALKQNKVKAGIMLGSAVMMAVGMESTLSHISECVTADLAAVTAIQPPPIAASKILSGSFQTAQKKNKPGAPT
jgi:hypothetical protein